MSMPAVVLKFDPNVMHHGGLGAIRSLGRLGVPVYGVHESGWAPAAWSRYLAGRLLWQADPGDPAGVRAALRELAGRIGQLAVLIPTDDAAAIFLAEHGDPLREWFAFPAVPASLPRRLAGKHSLWRACHELGFPAPAAELVTSARAARDFARRSGFPVAAKLTTPWVHGKALRSTTLAVSQGELDELVGACERAGAGLLLQEFIPPSPECDWFVHAYRGPGCQVVFTGVKDRSYPARAGLTSLGRAVPNPVLHGRAARLLADAGYQGIADLDLRYDHRDGQYKLLDFNPRLGAQFRLFCDTAGLDVVRAAYFDLAGRPVAAREQAGGRKFLVENYDPLAALSHWRAGELSPAAWAASLRGVSETAWYATDDLVPFWLMCARMGWRALSRPLGGRRGDRSGGHREPSYRPGRAAGRRRPSAG
ncbi:MAG: carboxylate--amine ligase, partial [Actinobacteria bacterium]|nr:carboxylate--amine ligase [Actinomycetota bacterium]